MPYTAYPVWSFPVNWDQGVLERLEWKTDVMNSEVGAEQRVARRLYPRRTFEAAYLLNKQDRQYFNVLMSTGAGKQIVTPIWHDLSTLTANVAAGNDTIMLDTRFREFEVGNLVFVRGPNARTYEVHTVEAITPTSLQLISNLEKSWPIGTRVYPAKLGRFESEVKPIKLTDELYNLQASHRLVTPSFVLGTASPSYKSSPVILLRPEDSEDQQFEYARSLAMLDNLFGKADYYDILGGPILRQTHKWTMQGASQHYDFRRFLYGLKGRAKALWLPTYMNDMTLSGPTGSGNEYIDIINIGVTANDGIIAGRSDIRIQLKDGTVMYREITDSVVLSESVERLALDLPVGLDLAVDDVVSISYMMIARLDQDSVELNHVTDATGITTCSLNFFGPTQAAPLVIPVMTSKPYPVDVLDALDTDATYMQTVLWTFDQPRLDIAASFVATVMPVVVSYEEYEYEESLDITAGHVSTLMPVVVSYEEYEFTEELDITAAFISTVMPVVVHYVGYGIEEEAMDIAATFVSTTMPVA